MNDITKKYMFSIDGWKVYKHSNSIYGWKGWIIRCPTCSWEMVAYASGCGHFGTVADREKTPEKLFETIKLIEAISKL